MFSKLSDKQREVLGKTGKFVVRACPGSGKTYCVSAKFSKLISEWTEEYKGIATISFTNTAWQEIRDNCIKDFDTHISYPHFLGTIDSFINQYIFLPFGHLVLGCEKRPIMVGEPYGIWNGGAYERDYNRYFDKVSYKIDGDLCPKNDAQYFFGGFPNKINANGKTVNGHYEKLQKMKKDFNEKGFATQADANYFALKILEQYPKIARSLALRFPVFIIDEAQDTTEIQMQIIDIIVKSGLENIMIVGDPDQAIFEWNDAKPSLFIEKEQDWKNNSIILDESWRSSQKICDVVYNFSSLGERKIIATNKKVKDCDICPEIWTYEETITGKKSTLNSFKNKCKEYGIEFNPKNVAVLFRSKSFFTQAISNPNRESPWLVGSPFTRDFALGKFLYDRNDFIRGMKYIERGFLKATQNISYFSEENFNMFVEERGFSNLRKELYKFVKLLPKAVSATRLGAWIAEANLVISSKNYEFELKINQNLKEAQFSQLFPQEHIDSVPTDYRPSTIHKVKGETFEAVLVFLKKKVMKSYKTMLANSKISEEEELRNVYVAISRPSRLLVIAVPDEENKNCWAEKLKIS
ncbi:MAG: Superfamily I DNA and RNA helicase [Parcubacteria group bacterium Athens0714_16]|nr:MAG: Superfamily I DNA and RNA helicase [Parcubacteria group bacterium Athens0714_16]